MLTKKSIPHRILAVILSLLMVLVLLPVTAAAGESLTYTAVTVPTSGKNYIIAVTDGATAHALDNGSMPTTEPDSANMVEYVDLTVDSGKVTTDDESLVWTVTSSGSDWLIKPAYGDNTDLCFYPGTSNSVLYLNSTERVWTYSGSKLTYSSKNLRYSASNHGFQYASTNSSNTITFYELEEVVEATDISLLPAATTIAQNDSLTLAATLSPSGATSTVTWESSAEAVATVADGVVTGLSAGTAVISATANGHSDSCTVTVSDTYTLVDTITSDGKYLIVSEYEGQNIALDTMVDQGYQNSSGYLYSGFTGAAIDFGDASTIKSDMIWVITGAKENCTIQNRSNTGEYLESTYESNGSGSGSTGTLFLQNTKATWIYSETSKIFTSNTSTKQLKYDTDALSSSSIDGQAANVLFTVRSTGNAVKLYEIHDAGSPVTTNAPAFSSTSCAMTSRTDLTADFTLTNSYTAPSFKIYATNTASEVAAGVEANLTGSTLTLTFTAPPTSDAVYYISATEAGCLESARTAVTVKAYAAANTYTQVTSITPGKTYLIVTLNNSMYVAMTGEQTDTSNSSYDYLKYTEVTDNLEGTTITLDAASAAKLEWVLAGSDTSITIYNNSAAKYAALSIKGSSKYGLALSDAGESWSYSDNQFKYTNASDSKDVAYLYSSTTANNANRYEFRANTDDEKASTIYLYEKQVGEPDYLAFTSDVHFMGSVNNLQTWLNKLDETTLDENDLDYMGFCGDMASGSASEESFWNYAQTMLTTVKNSSLIDDNDNGCIYTTGNHEYSNGRYSTTTYATADSITRIGKAVEDDNFIIYCFGAASGSQQFTDGDIKALSDYLATAPKNIPIIILSHFPIHYYPGRTTGNASALIDALNAAKHPNIIFLWGHNHTLSDTNYGIVFTEADSIYYTSTDYKGIDFTYAAAGCMSDSEYGGGSTNTAQKGMLMEVAPDGSSVTITYYGLNGNVVGASIDIEISGNAVSSDARLSSLSYTLNGVTKAVPGFNPSTVEYDVTLPYGTADDSLIALAGTCSSGDAEITANAGATVSGGAATAVITVKAEDGSTQTYEVNFTVSETEGTVYVPAGDFTEGGEYIIAYVDNGTAYCLDATKVSTDDSDATADAKVEAVYLNTITTSDENILWTVTKDDSNWYISPASGSHTDLKLYMGNGPTLYLDATGRAMAYDGSIISYTSSYSTYYLAYSGGSFTNSTGGSPIQLFTRVVNATGISIDDATVKEGRTIQLKATLTPTGANSPVVWSVVSGGAYASVDETGLVTGLAAGTGTISATANGYTDTCEITVTEWLNSDSSFLAFTSDTHYESGTTNNLDSWLTEVSDLYPTVDYMGFCGDIASTSSDSVEEYWEYVQAMIDTVNSHDDFVTEGGIYTTGNHEVYAGPTAGGYYASAKDSNDTAKLLTQTGEAAETDDYIIYAFGACNDGASSLIQEFTEVQIGDLKAYLEAASDDIPIFIMSHYPLHYDGNRVVERSEDVIDILNDYDNAIFLWGHNHSDVDDFENGYDNILKADSMITTLNDNEGTAKSTEIEFTYAPAGCMSDEEYPNGNGSLILGKGMIVEISDIESGGKNVTMTYYNLDGETFDVEGKVTDLSVNIGASTTNTYKLRVTAPAFDDVQYGYAQPAAQALTITCTGNTDATITSVSSGSTSFVIDGTVLTVPNGTSITSWTVRPAAGLTVGTHEAIITVTYNGGATATATVSLTVAKADQAAPSSVSGVNPTSSTDKGSITGVTTAMEYRKSDSSGWTACAGTTITGLEPGSYNVRYAGTDTLNPSPAITITITAYTSGGGGGGIPSGGGGTTTNYAVTATQSAGGTITLSAASVASGGSVTVTVTPDKDYGVSDVLVNGVSVGAVTSYTINNITADQTVTAVFGKVAGDTAWGNPYSDVSEGEWYYDAVRYVTEKGMFGGTSDTTFGPGLPMSRAMLATVLYRMDGKPAVSAANPFTDVPAGMWFTDAVLWAKQHEIVTGYADNTFRPNLSLTREQLAVMLYNYAKYKGFDMTLGKDFDLQSFNDASQIADYAREAMKWACALELIKGKPGSLLAPRGSASRAEVAAVLERFDEKIGG